MDRADVKVYYWFESKGVRSWRFSTSWSQNCAGNKTKYSVVQEVLLEQKVELRNDFLKVRTNHNQFLVIFLGHMETT